MLTGGRLAVANLLVLAHLLHGGVYVMLFGSLGHHYAPYRIQTPTRTELVSPEGLEASSSPALGSVCRTNMSISDLSVLFWRCSSRWALVRALACQGRSLQPACWLPCRGGDLSLLWQGTKQSAGLDLITQSLD